MGTGQVAFPLPFKKGCRVIVVGASGEIGGACVTLLNKLGVHVIATGRNTNALEALKNNVAEPSLIDIEQMDLASEQDSLPEHFRSLAVRYGAFDSFIYAAGIGGTVPLRSVDLDSLMESFAINLFAPVLLAKGFADSAVNRGEGSAMVFISSVVASLCLPGQLTYAPSKAALSASVKVMAKELVKRRIRCNSVSPAYVKTKFIDEIPKTSLEEIERKQVLGLYEPADIALWLVWLISDATATVTGQDYVLNCGLM